MKNLFDYSLQYYDEMQYFCLKNCFFQMLDFLGVKNPLLHIKLGLRLKVIYNKDTNNINVFKHELILPLFKMANVNSGQGKDFELIFKKNLMNTPVIVLVDVFYLPYRKEYKKCHASHTIFLTGYKNGEVEIIDWYKPYFFKGYISIDDFKLGRISKNEKDLNPFSGFEINNYWYKFNSDDFNTLPQEIIKLNIDDLISKVIYKDNSIYSGKEAFLKIKEWICLNINLDDLELKEKCHHLHDELFIFYRATILSKKYLDIAYASYPNLVEISIINCINYISKNLEKINFYLLKGSISKPRENMLKVIAEIEGVITSLSNLY